ncbi:MAG: hypothetical protein ABIJ37_02295 [Pseudomonadota bacterium]
MGSTEENEEIVELVDVIEEGPDLARFYKKSLKEPEGSRKEADLFNESGSQKELSLNRQEKEPSKEKFSIEEAGFAAEHGLQDEWEIEWTSSEDSISYKGHVKEVPPPELPNREAQPLEIPEESLDNQEVKSIGVLDDKTVEVIIREVVSEVIESIATKLTPDITEATIRAMNEKINKIAVELFPPIAEKIIKEEIEKLKQGGD